MEYKKILIIFLNLLVLSVLFSEFVVAEEEEDIMLLGFELEKIVALFSGLLALILFIVTFFAYRRDGRDRMLYVSIAFLLFAVKSFLISSELIFPEVGLISLIAVFLDFVILLSFFYGILKK